VSITYLHAAHANQSMIGQAADIFIACPATLTAQASSGDVLHEWIASLDNLERVGARHHRKRMAFLLERAEKDALLEALAGNRNKDGAADPQPDIVEIERGIAALLADPRIWDMVICRPEHRVLIETVLNHAAGLKSPHAMLFAGTGINVFACSPALDDQRPVAASRLLAYLHATIAMLVSLGAHSAARQIHTALFIAFDRGMMLEGMPVKTPYSTILPADEFAEAIVSFLNGTARRPIQDSVFGLAGSREQPPPRFRPCLIG